MTDWELLERYAQRGDNDAFAELVRRHIDMVYAAARRIAENDAEDATQAVFVLLAEKARELPERGALGGWLHSAT